MHPPVRVGERQLGRDRNRANPQDLKALAEPRELPVQSVTGSAETTSAYPSNEGFPASGCGGRKAAKTLVLSVGYTPTTQCKKPARWSIGSLCFEVITMKSSLASVRRTSNPVAVAAVLSCLLPMAMSVSAATSIYDENFDGVIPAEWNGTGVAVSAFGSDKYLEITQGDTLTYSFTLGALSNYSYSFWYSAWADVPGSSVFTVALDGNVIPVASTNDGSVTRETFNSFNPGPLASGILNAQFLSGPSVLLNTGNHTLQFKGLTGNDLDAHLDDFQSITTAVPEPGSWAMLLAGLGAMGVVGRRRRSRD